jgi:pyruvate formate lyase activating enzyme
MQQYPAWLSTPLDDNVVACLACNHRCTIQDGNKGICKVRSNHDGKLYLDVYGKVVARHVDPIEKKPLFHFYPGSTIASIGTVGCDFRCAFCQNWDISQYPKIFPHEELPGDLCLPEQVIAWCKEQDCLSLAFTYNEPAIFFEYAYDTAVLAKQEGIKTVYVSNGYETIEAWEKIAPFLDAVNIDIKSFRQEFYTKQCGAKLEPILKSVQWLIDHGLWVEVTTLLIPGENDSDQELSDIAEWIRKVSPEIPWHLSRYFPAFTMTIEPTPEQTMMRAYTIGKDAGLHNVYLGNILLAGTENTYCPTCGAVVIEREGYAVNDLTKKGCCYHCETPIAGRFA